MAERYRQWTRDHVQDDVRQRYTAVLLERLPHSARVLELGCGGGGPTTQALAARFQVTGVDLSARQIELARQHVPGATFMQGDITTVDFPPASFDAVASFYVFIHLPHGALPALLRKIGTWLRPGGLLVATMAAGNGGEIEPDFLGVPMYFSGYPLHENRRFVEAAGMSVLSAQRETILEDGKPVRFLWMVAQKPGE